MKRTTLLTLLMALCASFVQAASGGPDAFGYTWKDSNEPGGPVYNWVDISTIGTPVNGLADDNVVGPFNIPQGFKYYWYLPEQFWIGSNGYISFNSGNIAAPFPIIPNPTGVNDFIAPFLSDLNFLGAGNPAQCYYHQMGDSLIVSWINVPFWNQVSNYAGSNSFQIIINRQDFSITFNYKHCTGTTIGNDISIGIENITGGIGLQYSKNLFPPDSLAVKFYYPPVVNFSVTDAGIHYSENAKTAGIFVPANNNPRYFSTAVRNFGNQNLSNFSVSGSILMGTSTMALGTIPISFLAPGADTVVVFPTPFSTTIPDKYSFKAELSGVTNDMFAGNDSKQLRVMVTDTAASPMTLNYATGPNGFGLNWGSGNSGIGVHFVPPVYPCKLIATRFYHQFVFGGTGTFTAMIYRDNGLNGGPGTLIDSVTVPNSSIFAGVYTVVPLSNPNLTINSGGVYVLWNVNGTGLGIARDTSAPASRRTYEVISGVWADYRARDTEDFLIGLDLQPMVQRDLSVSRIVSPPAGFVPVSAYPVTVRIRNLGQQPASQFDVSYKAPNQPLVTEPYAGTIIQPGDSAIYVFSTLLSSNGLQSGMNLCAWTNISQDVNPSNDTACMVIGFPTAIQQLQENELKLYPNPANAQLNLSGLLPDPAEISLLDLQGRTLFYQHCPSPSDVVSLPVSTLDPGLYFLRVVQNNRVRQIPWSKQ